MHGNVSFYLVLLCIYVYVLIQYMAMHIQGWQRWDTRCARTSRTSREPRRYGTLRIKR